MLNRFGIRGFPKWLKVQQSSRSLHVVCSCPSWEKQYPRKRNLLHQQAILTIGNSNFTQHRSISKESIQKTVNYIAESFSDFVVENFNADVPMIKLGINILTYCHESIGLPWWTTICLVTIGFKAFMQLPLQIYAIKNYQNLNKLNKDLEEKMPELMNSVRLHAAEQGWDHSRAKNVFNRIKKEYVDEYKKREKIRPIKTVAPVFVQLPVWITLSLSLRHLSGSFFLRHHMNKNFDVKALDMEVGGILWFPNLLIPEPIIMPIILCGANLIILKMSYDQAMKYRGKLSKWDIFKFTVMMSYIFLVFPITCIMPSCMSYYWTLSAISSVGLKVLFDKKSFLDYIGIQNPSPLIKAKELNTSNNESTMRKPQEQKRKRKGQERIYIPKRHLSSCIISHDLVKLGQ